MMTKTLLVLLGNQLFSIEEIKENQFDAIFMAEDYGLCTYEKHHKLKILMFLTSMREKRDEFIANNFEIEYQDLERSSCEDSYEDKLLNYIKKNKISEVKMFEIEDKDFEKRLTACLTINNIPLTFIRSPMFLLRRDDFPTLCGKSSTLRMANFYKNVRRKLDILIDENQKPVKGKWSFDEENRKKIPKDHPIPDLYKPQKSKYIGDIKNLITKRFNDHPGNIDNVWMPLNRKDALASIDYFLRIKFKKFGDYEDAILKENTFLFHSGISASLNIGLITPDDVLTKVFDYVKVKDIPINSLEGFVRQVIGWREFIRGVYQHHGTKQLESNYFNFSRNLKISWYDGTTGIDPLDDAIVFSKNFGYTHHINRLMVIANIMTLCEVCPKIIYKWFMEMYVDSSEWVMVPNVFGMGTFADGGIFSTKPYICGSNYILKMSNYKKGNWCNIVDGLYWLFINRNIEKLKGNPRLPFIKKTLENMDESRKKLIFSHAENFIALHCY
jgi:deoxyribodipyrimidine photolyase-related protein|tara:strand:+ start:311 stop:1807 length:1497 start_codon:yes stop_codon:yes gene_type:complete